MKPDLFDFEADFAHDLRCIPLVVRFKLDTCGVKLKLLHWHQFSLLQRQNLISLPCQSANEIDFYRQQVRQMVYRLSDTWPDDIAIATEPSWLNDNAIPGEVSSLTTGLGYVLGIEEWQCLEPVQRFALIKLSHAGHEHRNFARALAEFGLIHNQ